MALLAPAGVGIAALVSAGVPTASSDSPPRGVTPLEPAAEVAAHPRRFRWVRVGIQGRVAERPQRLPRHLRNSFVLAGERTGRLLVVPPTGATLERQAAGARVAVRGRVVPARRLKRRSVKGTLTRAELVERTGATAVVKAVSVRPAP